MLRRISSTPKLRVLLAVAAVAIAADQASKLWIDASIEPGGRTAVIEDFFYISHVRNPGAAFGLFQGGSATLRIGFFTAVSAVAAIIILSFFRRLAPGDRFSALALALVLGGAAGNLVDRLLRGAVVDFLHFRLWGGLSWPDFNLADAFIVTGVVLLVIELLATESEARGRTRGAEGERRPR